jgi:F-type H+-transporting ATPase subunit c
MDFHVALGFGLPIALGIAAVGSALALGRAVSSAMDAIARQPEAANKVLINMIIGCAFIEAITIYVLVFGFILSGRI